MDTVIIVLGAISGFIGVIALVTIFRSAKKTPDRWVGPNREFTKRIAKERAASRLAFVCLVAAALAAMFVFTRATG